MPAWLRSERVEFCLAVIIGVIIGVVAQSWWESEVALSPA